MLIAYGIIAQQWISRLFIAGVLPGLMLIVLTSPVVLPMLAKVGWDPIWFGIYLVVVVEMAQITPPVGFNLFILQNLTGRDIWQVTKATMPFFGVMILAIVMLSLFPGIATFLPGLMTDG